MVLSGHSFRSKGYLLILLVFALFIHEFTRASDGLIVSFSLVMSGDSTGSCTAGLLVSLQCQYFSRLFSSISFHNEMFLCIITMHSPHVQRFSGVVFIQHPLNVLRYSGRLFSTSMT